MPDVEFIDGDIVLWSTGGILKFKRAFDNWRAYDGPMFLFSSRSL